MKPPGALAAMTRRRDYDHALGAGFVGGGGCGLNHRGVIGGTLTLTTTSTVSKTEERAMRESERGVHRASGGNFAIDHHENDNDGAGAEDLGFNVGGAGAAARPTGGYYYYGGGYNEDEDEDDPDDDGTAFFADLAGSLQRGSETNRNGESGGGGGGGGVGAGKHRSTFPTSSSPSTAKLSTISDMLRGGTTLRIPKRREGEGEEEEEGKEGGGEEEEEKGEVEAESFWCSRCGREVESTEDEHRSWHVARDLQEEYDREEARAAAAAAATSQKRTQSQSQSQSRVAKRTKAGVGGGGGGAASRGGGGGGGARRGRSVAKPPPGTATLDAFFSSKS